MPQTPKHRTGSRRDFLVRGSAAALGAAAVGGWLGQVGALRAEEGTPVAGCPPKIRDAFRGPCPSLSTPFTRRGEIDFDAVSKMLDFMLAAKAKAIILTMGDSLFTILTDDEVAQLTKFVCGHVNKRALVVAADKSWWTGKDVEFAAYCAQLGADLLMVLPPDWAASCTVESLVAHYRAMAQKIPVMVVDNYLSERPLSFALELITRLRDEVPGVVALKDDAGKELARRIALLTRDRWALMASGKELHMNIYPYGVDGWMSTYMTFKPEIAWRYKAAIDARDLEAARIILRDYELPLLEFLGTFDGGFDAGVHGLLEIYGLAKRYRRPPYHSLTDDQMRTLSGFLKKKGLL
jgi:4-hydroxy-tetrahydrodipicolinate synthase